MESTSEFVLKEQTKSSVSKKCVQEVSSTSVQNMASSALVGDKSLLAILESDGSLIGNQMATDGMMMASIPASSSSLSLSLPIITSPSLPEDGNVVNISSLKSEFSAMKLKDEHGKEIGEVVQEKQQQQSVKASCSVTTVEGGSKSTSSVSQVSSATTSSLVQQSATSLVAEAQESLSSVSCSSFISTKKQEAVSSSTRSLSSINTSQAIETVVKPSTAVVEDQEF